MTKRETTCDNFDSNDILSSTAQATLRKVALLNTNPYLCAVEPAEIKILNFVPRSERVLTSTRKMM